MTELTQKLPLLLGLRCWAVVAGIGNGSMATLHLGRKILRSPALTNPHLSDEAKRYRGEYCLFVKGCKWELRVGSRVVCDSTDPERTIGVELTGRLTDSVITGAGTAGSSKDLRVAFGDQAVLNLFCHEPADQGIENYAIRFPSGWIKVDQAQMIRTAPA